MYFTMQCVRRTERGFVQLVMRGDYTAGPDDEEVDIEPGELLDYSIRAKAIGARDELDVLFWEDPDSYSIWWPDLPGPPPPPPRSLVKEPVSWAFYEETVRSTDLYDTASYHEPSTVLYALQALYNALKEHEELYPKAYYLVSPTREERNTVSLQISGRTYEIDCGVWDTCYARGEDGRIVDLRDKRWIQGFYQGSPTEFAVKAESFFQIYGEGHLRGFMEVCQTALRHGWWIETCLG